MPRPALDRTYPLADPRFGHANPDRVHVTRMRTGWWVWRGTKPLRILPTHTEAIRWAHANACIGLHASIGGRYVYL